MRATPIRSLILASIARYDRRSLYKIRAVGIVGRSDFGQRQYASAVSLPPKPPRPLTLHVLRVSARNVSRKMIWEPVVVTIAPPKANVVPTGHVARAVPAIVRGSGPRVSIVRDTSFGAGPGPQYAIDVSAVCETAKTEAETRQRSAATRSSLLTLIVVCGLIAKPPATTTVPAGHRAVALPKPRSSTVLVTFDGTGPYPQYTIEVRLTRKGPKGGARMLNASTVQRLFAVRRIPCPP